MELAKSYNPKDIEMKWYPVWENGGYFKPSNNEDAQNYSIMLPPPNVTGTLHMGHGFQHTLMDILIRYHRMNGYNTLWQPGTDHAGIATQILVERQLEQQGIKREDLGREEFIKRVWEWKELSGGTITNQMRRLGASCDWSRERFTMDSGLINAVNEVFVSLYEKGFIYRGTRLVNWDVKLKTAVSDLEVTAEEEIGSLWYIRYPINNSTESIVIATTRPETMLGDVAVAVSVDDERYKHLIGKMIALPLSNRLIPIIADEYVDPSFGSGCVKITPAHDFNDFEVGKRHGLEPIIVFTLDGFINENAPLKYQGMERLAARKQILKDLEELGLLVETKSHKLMVPRSERTGVIIEPMLTSQWFVAMRDFADKALKLVKNGDIKFVPENWVVTYNNWLENIQDWCISRQLWWGHRIPVYYDKNGNYYVARSFDEAVKLSGTTELIQDDDVLDTWFSSALWCFSTLDWPNDTVEMQKFLPTNVLVTGFDIIFFWVARMIMFTEHFTGKVPFKDIYITGLIQDANGNKMSKSKGNIIDPLDLIDGISIEDLVAKRTANLMNPSQAEKIEKQTRKEYPEGFQAYGADALRFTFAALSTHGREIRFDVKRIEGSRNFCNKLWNATRFVLMNTENHASLVGNVNILSLVDQWILLEFAQLIEDIELAFKTYRFDIASQRIYEFIWNEYCDWYVELAKVNINSSDCIYRMSTISTLLQVLEGSLRLIHPIIPFISEELWQVVANVCNKKEVDSIMLSSYPKSADFIPHEVDPSQVFTAIDWLKSLIGTIRNLRAEMNINPSVKVPLIIEANEDELFDFNSYIMSLAKISEIKFVSKLDDTGAALIAVSGKVRLMLKVEIDTEQEKNRLKREIDRETKGLDKIMHQLNNKAFIERAPKELVERNIARSNELKQIIDNYSSQLNKLG